MPDVTSFKQQNIFQNTEKVRHHGSQVQKCRAGNGLGGSGNDGLLTLGEKRWDILKSSLIGYQTTDSSGCRHCGDLMFMLGPKFAESRK